MDAAANEYVPADKQTLAVEALVEGCPEAFIDFFYLTTPDDGVGDDNLAPEELEAHGVDPKQYEQTDEVSVEHMQFLKDSLVAADASSRRQDFGGVTDAYRSLAKFFAGADHPKKAVFFYDKCLHVASQAGDVAAEMEANADLGGAHESMGDVASAVAAFERQARMAETSGDNEQLRVSRGNLIRIYRAAAARETSLAGGNAEAGVGYLQKCLETAKLDGDGSNPTAEGFANHRLGLAHLASGDHERATEHLKEYLRLCMATGDRAGEGSALRSLAAVCQARGDDAGAIANLEAFLEIAKTGDPRSQASACCSLGKIYSAQGKHDWAVMYFDRFFEVARGLNDRRMLDVARVNLGVARGAARATGMLKAVAGSHRQGGQGRGQQQGGAGGEGGGEEEQKTMTALLQWKNVRTPLDTAPAAVGV